MFYYRITRTRKAKNTGGFDERRDDKIYREDTQLAYLGSDIAGMLAARDVVSVRVAGKAGDGGVELPPLRPGTVTAEKLTALERALGLRPGNRIPIRFKNGSEVVVEERIVVTGAVGGRAVFEPGELRAAYAMAL